MDNLNMADLALFAGQSNMSGRGDAREAGVCGVEAGFEYKSVSKPDALVPVKEPFGLGEDRKGALDDIRADGTNKRSGSMVSAVVSEYYSRTKRKLVAVSASKGGTNTEEWKETLIGDAVRRLCDAKKFLADNNIKIGRIFVVWCQGESDGDAQRTAGDYISNTDGLFREFIKCGAEKIFVVQTGHYNYVKYPENAERDGFYAVIRAAQERLCAENDDYILVGSFEPYIAEMKDQYHYRQSAYNAVGKTVGENIAKYYGGEL